ncbi:MAG: glycosyltransferase family 4 protein [Candidatus Kerfeldbacteria bacterium]|nr:glycosyltransferase family 4 protein [Candidatus Kerfeldbacteria bacterium]
MRIGLDARFYGPHAGTGIGRYTNRLIEQLERLDQVNAYVVFLRDDNFDFYHPANPRFSKVRAPWRWYSLGEQVGFPRLLRAHRLELTHFLHFNVPLAAPAPFITTIHDLILNKFPTARASTLGPVRYWFKHAAYQAVIRTAARRAERLIAVTQHTKHDVVTSFRLPPDKVDVVYEAADAAQPLPLVSAEQLKRKFGLSDPFIFYVGTAYPHKNLERLVEAIARLNRSGTRLTLVLAGRDDYFYRRLKKLVALRGYNQRERIIVFTGYINDDVLDAFYRAAQLYVCPSLYEGFGLPGLEAMARGTPVLSARRSSLPEVYGDAAAYVDSENVTALAASIGQLLRDDAQRQELRRRGFSRIQQFSWEKMAEQTLAVYNAIGAKHL